MKFVMYSLFIIITILKVSKTDRIMALTDEEKECVKQLAEDEDRIQDLYFRYISPEDDTQFNRFVECVWNKLGFLTGNGDVNYEKLKNSYEIDGKVGIDNPEVLDQLEKLVFSAVSKCESNHGSLKSDSTAKTVVKVQNCIGKNFNEALEPFYPEF